MASEDKKQTKKIVGIVVDAVMILFFCFALLITIVAYKGTRSDNGVPNIGKSYILCVQTNSMSPTFDAGDMIIGKTISREQSENLKADDVITFYIDLNHDGVKEINTHRIVEVINEGGFVKYRTKGDNNPVNDNDLIYSSDVICVWNGKKAGGLGKALDWLKSPNGFLITIVLPMVAFFLYEVFRFIVLFNKAKNEGKRQITESDEEEIKRKAIEEYLRQKALEDASKELNTEDQKQEDSTEENKDN